MKKFYITLFALLIAFSGYILVTNAKYKNGMSVRENIVQTDTSYSWEQWCWYGSKKVHVGNFTLNGTVTNVGNLDTTICD